MTETKTKKRKSRPNTEKYQPLTKPLSDEGLDLVDYANRPVRSCRIVGEPYIYRSPNVMGLLNKERKFGSVYLTRCLNEGKKYRGYEIERTPEYDSYFDMQPIVFLEENKLNFSRTIEQVDSNTGNIIPIKYTIGERKHIPWYDRYTPEQLKVIMETGSAEAPYTSDFVSVKEPTERDTALRPIQKEADIKPGDFVLLSYGKIATYGTFTSVLKRSNMTSWELSENVLETKLGTNKSNIRVYHLYNEEEYNRFMRDLRKIRKLRERKIFMKG
jgi:hypothetical protein